MTVMTRSMSSKTRSSAKPPRPTTCTCVWCRTWKPRKVYYRTRRAVKKERSQPTPKATKSTFLKRKPRGTTSAAATAPPTPATGQVDSIAAAHLAHLDAPLRVATLPDGHVMDASLVLVDLAQNMDKYYLIQLIQANVSSLGGDSHYYCFTRWGRTGTAGQHQLDGPHVTLAHAQAVFESKFHEKTGQAWHTRASFAQIDGKYDLLRVDYEAKANGQWEYYMDDFVDGKATGWYPYTAGGTTQMEFLWQTHQANATYNSRIVQSGHYSYRIDLTAMTQTNISTEKLRRIRRRR